MNKTAIKNYAVWARNKLISDIEYKAGLLGVTDKGAAAPLPQSTGDVQFFDIGTKDYATVQGQDVSRRRKFIDAIQDKARDGSWAEAFHQIVEKAAYTWFNRLAAIRFMEVNDYLPSHVRVLSSENENKAEPDMVTRPFDLDIAFSAEEQEHILHLQDENRLDELFRWLFVRQCRKLQGILPQLFASMDDYMELLLTISFTDKDGVLWHLVHDIPEKDFRIRTPEDETRKEVENLSEDDMPAGQVEIIGWLYQYYNTEPKKQVFADLDRKIKISKDRIPAATQFFTPDWIVRYMVENSLGRLWVEGHPNEELKKSWKYYLEEAPQEPQVQAQLDEIQKEYAAIRPEDIKVIDPCMGSGHILVYLFDVLMQIYESQGWTRRDAARSIMENNLYGLDIDDRAEQLAYFAVMMKARQYDRRFLERGIQPHVYSTACFPEGEEYGSLLITDDPGSLPEEGQMSLDDKEQIVRHILAQKYDVVVTNPPYMPVSNAGFAMQKYVKGHYPDSKTDLFASFIERCGQLAKRTGYQAMVTQHSWMFLSSFEKLRLKLQAVDTVNMAHLGARAFEEIGGEVVQTTSFVLRKNHVKDYAGSYCRLVEPTTQQGKEDMFLAGENRYTTKQSNFSKIPGSPVAYWVSKAVYQAFESATLAGKIAQFKHGMSTGKNEEVVRHWYEVEHKKIYFNATSHEEFYSTGKRYVPYNKGGDYRKWYGNQEYILGYDVQFDALMDTFPGHRHDNKDTYFIENISWSKVSSGSLAMRYFPKGFVYDVAGCSAFAEHKYLKYLLAFYNGTVKDVTVSALSPTLNYEVGQLKCSPILYSESKQLDVESLVDQCLSLSRTDWDSYETSWDFQIHPMVPVYADDPDYAYRVSDFYNAWKERCQDRFDKLKANEEELNRIFIDIYGLQDELTPEVEDRDVTVRLADLGRDIRSLISYAVGCMFGRYSANGPVGLIYAGGEWDPDRYGRFQPDADNCIPITDEAYFEDDIVGRFVEFIRIVYGERTLEENLQFIASALGGKGDSSRDVIRRYFLNDFYKDHVKIYQKRPIYWLFDSGKQNGFKALVYMHRWNADTVGNLRVEYLHKMQRVYEKEIERMQDTEANSGDGHEVAQAAKRREKLVKQLKETRDYDTKLAHIALSRVDIDLDDGVKVNYEKVQHGPDGKSLGILAKI